MVSYLILVVESNFPGDQISSSLPAFSEEESFVTSNKEKHTRLV